MLINSFVNYGGRLSRLCFSIPMLVHVLLISVSYFIYYNLSLFSIYVLVFMIVFINIEWIVVIVYEYMYLYNSNVNNNLLYNMILFIFLEVVLFAGVYWFYLNHVINSNNSMLFNSNTNYYMNICSVSSSVYAVVCNSGILSNTDMLIFVVISNLLILLYVTLILQYVHLYLNI
jgi:hypothetical protein